LAKRPMKITLEISTQLTVEEAWRRLTNWRAHGEWIPLTKMIILREGEKPGLGDKFIGRTGIGPIAFDDVMTVTQFEAPGTRGFCEVTKSGRLIKGSASFEVKPTDAGTVVIWVEDIPLPILVDKVLGGLLKLAGGLVFTSALRKALRP
jgi:carbon monoxide dehydrogenase subunit G